MKGSVWKVKDGNKIYFIYEWYVHGSCFYKWGSHYIDGSGYKEDWHPTYRGARKMLLTDKRLKKQ